MKQVTQQQLEWLIDIAIRAGDAIMSIYMRSNFDVQVKEDLSPLTEADILADRVIRQGLEMYFPTMFVLSEESVSGGQEVSETFFLIDPLDGTKEFIKRNDEFTVNIALVHQGCVIAGIVYAPALDELFYAAKGLGVWKKNQGLTQSIHVMPIAKGEALRVIGSRSHGGYEVQEWLEKLDRPYVFSAVGSSLKFCRIAEGQADIYPRFGLTSQWDTAAAQGVLEIAGGKVCTLDNERLAYSLERNMLNPYFIASAV